MRIRPAVLALTMVGSLLVMAPAQSSSFPPQVARGLTVPAGFAARVFAQVPDGQLPTGMIWADDPDRRAAAGTTGDGALHGVTLYVSTISGDLFSTGTGKIYAFPDEGGAGTLVAEDLDMPLGMAMGEDHTLYISENDPGAGRGRVTALTDTNGDGAFDGRRTVIGNLPNGRHQTNDVTFGPDGLLYVANGNATDNGLECGPETVPGAGVECDHPELKPWSGAILRVDPDWDGVDLLEDVRTDGDGCYSEDGLALEDVLVSSGYRNIYGLDFDPQAPHEIWTPMNGSDDPSSSEPLYSVDVENEQICRFEEPEDPEDPAVPVFGPIIEDAGFPSCLYDPHINTFPIPDPLGHSHPGIPDPQDNPHQGVIDEFGRCPVDTVHRPESIFSEGHEGTAGIAFERGDHFPDRYRNDLFVAEWGSLWNLNGLAPTGHKVIHVDLDEERNVVRQREFMTGSFPIDVTFGPNGMMYVADFPGQIYEVRHVTDAATPDVVRVDMTQGQFVPQVVTVVSGQTVRWVNGTDAAQNVRAAQKVRPKDPRQNVNPLEPGSEMNSPGDIPPGGDHSFTFWEPWSVYHYSSQDSNTMRGTIVVLPMER